MQTQAPTSDAAQADPGIEVIEAPAWLPAHLDGVWTFLAGYPPVLALVIVLVGISVALLGRGIVLFWGRKLSTRSGRIINKQLLRIAANAAAVILSCLAIVLAIQVLGLAEVVERTLIRITLTLLVFRLMLSTMRAGHVGLETVGRFNGRFTLFEPRTLPLFGLIMTLLVFGAGTYVFLMIWDINPTAWLASAGVIGIAIGFAARDTLANLFAGFFIIADAPYKLGDYIVLGTGERGEVTKVGMRSTRILTRDDVEITVPNSMMASSQIYNESGGKWERFRIRIKVGVAYGSDVDQVCAVLMRVAGEHETVCKEPTPRIRMRGFGDSSLNFELLCWVDQPVKRGVISHELCMAVYKAFNEAGIELPFPQRDIRVRDAGGLPLNGPTGESG